VHSTWPIGLIARDETAATQAPLTSERLKKCFYGEGPIPLRRSPSTIEKSFAVLGNSPSV